jgi:FHA domain
MQVVLHVGGGGQVLRVLPGEFILGRDPACNIRLLQSAVSRRHRRLAVTSKRVTIKELGSRNHTLVNSRRVTDEQTLADGDCFALCDNRFHVRLLSDNQPPDPAWMTVRPQGPRVTVNIPLGRPQPHPELVSDPTRTRGDVVPTRICISGPFIGGSARSRGLDEVERGLIQFLGAACKVDWAQTLVPGLCVSLLLYDEEDLESLGQRLVVFLANWGVPDGARVSLTREVPGEEVRHLRLEVPNRTFPGLRHTDGER